MLPNPNRTGRFANTPSASIDQSVGLSVLFTIQYARMQISYKFPAHMLHYIPARSLDMLAEMPRPWERMLPAQVSERYKCFWSKRGSGRGSERERSAPKRPTSGSESATSGLKRATSGSNRVTRAQHLLFAIETLCSLVRTDLYVLGQRCMCVGLT